MGSQPVATVNVIHRPDFGPQAVMIEVSCPERVTSLLNRLGDAHPDLRGALLIAAACTEHELRCGRCDLSDARAHADVQLRTAPEEAWIAWGDERRQRLLRELWD